MRFRRWLFDAMGRRELALSRATLAVLGPAAMPTAAATPRIKGRGGRAILSGLGGAAAGVGGATVAAGDSTGGGATGGAGGGGATSATTGGGGSRDRVRATGAVALHGGFCLLRSELGSARFRFLEDLVVFFLVLVEEVGNVKESVTFEADIHKRRLHARAAHG